LDSEALIDCINTPRRVERGLFDHCGRPVASASLLQIARYNPMDTII
jgi:hypothetical protein